jgi:DNA recombination protein Rad52
MPFAEAQIRQLSGKLLERHVRSREEGGIALSYVEGWHVIAEANRVFGFDGWDREMIVAECVWQDGRNAVKACAYAARIRIRVRAGDTLVYRDGSGVGHGNGATLGEAHERALKEAETDATKRALTTFGNLFGLALYDKEKLGMRRAPRRKPLKGGEGSITWTLIGADGEPVNIHGEPQDFCRAFKEAMHATTTEVALNALWERNRLTLACLRTALPDLRTGKGHHYADVLARHFEQQVLRLRAVGASLSTQTPAETANAGIDKSELAIGTPKRIRDGEHLQFVAAQPCLVCGRTPAQAHHLRFAQPRSMGSKVSDEWTVPLCLLHHRALHDVGDEQSWWEERKIDAKSEASKMWRDRQGMHREVPTVEDTIETTAI